MQNLQHLEKHKNNIYKRIKPERNSDKSSSDASDKTRAKREQTKVKTFDIRMLIIVLPQLEVEFAWGIGQQAEWTREVVALQNTLGCYTFTYLFTCLT